MRILIVGFGGVARAFVKLLEERRGELYRQRGLSPRLVGVVDSQGAAISERGLDVAALLAAKEEHDTVAALAGQGVTGVNADTLIAESDADVVIEATPSRLSAPSAAIGHLKTAFRTGKHAVSVNKAPLAIAMPALLELSRYNRVEFRFSGTVGGGTPVLAFARECSRGNQIVRVRAILNGTTNFILSRMHDAGETYEAALAEAVRLGYAERDPSADVDGIDTATKVVIFANWILGRPATIQDVAITGIRGFPKERIAEAKGRGQVVKLIGEMGEKFSVSPQEVPAGSPLHVPANLNAVTLTLRWGGDVTLVGRGAGGVETATAILRDLLDIWEHR